MPVPLHRAATREFCTPPFTAPHRTKPHHIPTPCTPTRPVLAPPRTSAAVFYSPDLVPAESADETSTHLAQIVQFAETSHQYAEPWQRHGRDNNHFILENNAAISFHPAARTVIALLWSSLDGTLSDSSRGHLRLQALLQGKASSTPLQAQSERQGLLIVQEAKVEGAEEERIP
jgi:hypothetical protein